MQSFNKAKARAEEALNHFEELENEDFLTYKQKDSAPDWEIVPKRSPRRMSYDDVFQVITKYAHEMQPYFADGWSRFPQGGNAAMIANYLNDKADFYRTIDTNIANDLLDSATEIIVRCG